MSEWQGRFSTFIDNTAFRPKAAAPKDRAAVQGASELAAPEASGVASQPSAVLTMQIVREKWKDFILHLEASGQSVMSANLFLCDLVDLTGDVKGYKLQLLCLKNFAYEMLTAEEFSLSEKASAFFGGKVFLDVRLDRTKVETVFEKTPTELLLELAKTNKVIKFLIDAFGAEPNY